MRVALTWQYRRLLSVSTDPAERLRECLANSRPTLTSNSRDITFSFTF